MKIFLVVVLLSGCKPKPSNPVDCIMEGEGNFVTVDHPDLCPKETIFYSNLICAINDGGSVKVLGNKGCCSITNYTDYNRGCKK